MSQHEEQVPSQHIGQVNNSAISNAGDAFNFNIARDQYISVPAPFKPWKPPLMLPPRAQSFVGREEDFDWLLQQLHDKAGKILAICGPGGMGKTALAAEALSYLIAQEQWSVRFPDGIFYHSFYTYPSLAVAFEELARIFEEEPDGDPRLAARRAMSRRCALLVFDGVEDLDDTRPLRELGGKNVVLLLSRRQSDAPDFAHRRTLSVLPQDQGIMLLQELAGPRAADRPCVERLVQRIKGYPLALQLIGSYLSSQEEEVGDYLRWFEHEGLTAVNFGEHQAQSVPVLLQYTFNALAQNAQYVFLLLGLLAAAPFPLELVQDILELPEHTVRQALGSLVNLSVLRRPDRNYEVSHPLVHTFATEHLSSQVHAASSLSSDTITKWREQFLTTLTTHFEQSNPYDKSDLALWYPHVLPLVSAEHLTVQQSLVAARLFNTVGVDATTQGKYRQAEPLLKQALTIREQQLGPDHPDTATSLNNLAGLYWKQGKYGQAEPLLQQALTICEQQLGPDHLDTAQSLNNLAGLYWKQGKYGQAEPLLQRALSIDTKAYGDEHPEIATDLNNLAALYSDQGKYGQAEPLLKQALSICEQQLGPDHPDTATSLNNLAALYWKQSKYGQAEPLYQRALAIDTKAYGAEHPEVATELNNLASLYQDQGKDEQAEPLLKQALSICEQQLGPEHPDTATSLNNLAGLYWKQGKYGQAEPLLQRALSICGQQLGPHHPHTAQSLNNLANLYRAQGKDEQAEPLYQRALAIRERQSGPRHSDTALSLNNLAELYWTQGKYEQAEPLYLRALTIREQQLGPLHPSTATSLNNLAQIYSDQEKYEQAKPLFQRALSIDEKALGPLHPTTQTIRANYADLLRTMGHDAEATALDQP